MKFVDELYHFYRNRLVADEEAIDLIVASLLSEMDRNDWLRILSELNDRDLYKVTAASLAEKLREKLIEEGSGPETGEQEPRFYH
jgi:hypothetical protein